MDKYKFGEFIYSQRKKLGYTQDELGRKLKVTNKAVSKWETGETLPDIQLIPELASVLNVTIDELLTQEKPSVEKVLVDHKKGVRIFLWIMSSILLLITTLLTINLIKITEDEVKKWSDSKIVLDCPTGMGKTTLINQFVAKVSEGRVLFLSSRTALTEQQLKNLKNLGVTNMEVKTYQWLENLIKQRKTDTINNYIYELYSPVTAHEFFSHPIFNIVLYVTVYASHMVTLIN